MSVNVSEEIEAVNALLRASGQMFERNMIKPPHEMEDGIDPDDEQGSYMLYHVRWPYYVPQGVTDGFVLKDGMGYITIEKIYRHKGKYDYEEVAHTYRYINTDHIYECSHTTEAKPATINYHFRYDKDIRPRAKDDPDEHLQILHSAPRFLTHQITLDDFLEVVKATCFNEKDNMRARPAAFFANKR